MDKNTKTILMVGAGVLVLGGVGWWIFRPRKARKLGSPEEMRQMMQTSLRQSAAMGPGAIIAMRKSGKALRSPPPPPPLPGRNAPAASGTTPTTV